MFSLWLWTSICLLDRPYVNLDDFNASELLWPQIIKNAILNGQHSFVCLHVDSAPTWSCETFRNNEV